MTNRQENHLSKLGLKLKSLNLSYYAHQAPALLLIVFFTIVLLFLFIIALIDPVFRWVLLIFIIIISIYFAVEFHFDPYKFMSEKGILQHDKQKLSSKGSESIMEGEIVEATRPVFTKKKNQTKKEIKTSNAKILASKK